MCGAFDCRITQRRVDEVDCNSLAGSETASLDLSQSSLDLSQHPDSSTVIARGRRVSLTFRKVKHSPCSCSKLVYFFLLILIIYPYRISFNVRFTESEIVNLLSRACALCFEPGSVRYRYRTSTCATCGKKMAAPSSVPAKLLEQWDGKGRDEA